MAGRFGPLTAGVYGTEPRQAPFATPEEATIRDVSAAGATFILASSPGVLHGPAPWPIGPSDDAADAIATGRAPVAGDRCLVLWAGVDHVPWICGWWR